MTFQMLVTDDTGATLDVEWAKALLERTGLKLQIVAERDDDIYTTDAEHGCAPPPPELSWTVSLVRAAYPPVTLAEVECQGRARVRAAKQLLVALDAGLL